VIPKKLHYLLISVFVLFVLVAIYSYKSIFSLEDKVRYSNDIEPKADSLELPVKAKVPSMYQKSHTHQIKTKIRDNQKITRRHIAEPEDTSRDVEESLPEPQEIYDSLLPDEYEETLVQAEDAFDTLDRQMQQSQLQLKEEIDSIVSEDISEDVYEEEAYQEDMPLPTIEE